jgi:hypothetical protein
MAAFGTSTEGRQRVTRTLGSSWTNGVWASILNDFAGSQR